MNRTSMGAAAGIWLVAITGCGDGPSCPSEIVVAITSPTGDVTVDGNSAADGVQTDISVRSNLREGDGFTLTILQGDTELATHEAIADGNGEAVFADITVPTGQVTLSVTGDSEDCGAGTDEVDVNVGNQDCLVTVREGPTANDFYGVPVLNTGHDTDSGTAGFQGNVDVETTPGYTVEVFLTETTESSVGTSTADAAGDASIAISISDGMRSLRAVCESPGGGASDPSLATVLYVDTVAPVCTLEPADGTTIIPAMDTDGSAADTQIVLTAHSDDTDVEGENAQFNVDGADLLTPAIDADGDTSVTGTFDTVGQVPVTFHSQDHADNACDIARNYTYQTEGCLIAIAEPAGVITTDADSNPNNGVQYDLDISVDTDCNGQTVTTDCDVTGAQTGVVTAGATQIRVTLCTDDECEVTRNCMATVSTTTSIMTSDGVMLEVDTLPPVVQLDLLQPNTLVCGAQYDSSIDYNGIPGDGVQIRVRANDTFTGTDRWIEFTPDGGSPTVIPVDAVTKQADVTLELGANLLFAVAEDAAANQSRAPLPSGCTIVLSDISVNFDANIADGVIGPNDSGVVVTGSDVTLDICGTVSRTTATVTVDIDGSGPLATVQNGNDWCRNDVTLGEGNHTLVADAVDGAETGTNTIDPLVVDLTGPSPPTGALLATVNRQQADFSWTAPQNGGPTTPAASYLVKVGTVAFTAGNFDSNGTALSAPTPSTPGQTDGTSAVQLRPGTPYFFGVIALDSAGNRSAVLAAGPHQVAFTGTGEVDPTLTSPDDGFGYRVTGGDFDDDGTGDLAVGAPYTDTSAATDTFEGVIYLYLGQNDGSGIDADDPEFIISADPAEQFGFLGWALTTIDWDGDATDDLVVSAPFQDSGRGRIFVFLGGLTFDPGTATTPIIMSQSDADLTIETDGSGAFFNPGRCGFSLASGRFNSSDASDDLVVGCTEADGARGGVLVLFGGATTPDPLVLSDSGGGDMGTLRVYRMRFAGEPANSTFGHRVINVGRTEGTSDQTDDFGIAPFATGTSTPNKIYVYRGRAAAPAIGLTDLAFDAAIDLDLSDGTAVNPSAFGETLSTVGDLNGDGARDLVVPDSRATGGGYLSLVDGDAVGVQTLASVQISRITGGSGITRLGSAVVSNHPAAAADIDNDGLDDLVATGRFTGNVGRMFVWYGGLIPTSGTVTAAATVDHTINAPAGFDFAQTADWVGDVNGDGLADICYAGDETPVTPSGRWRLEVLHR